jgi:hypothetical protein
MNMLPSRNVASFARKGTARFAAVRLACLLFPALMLMSCTGHIGYGVINWSVPTYGLTAGDVVPVFIQSNIGQVYVIGVGKNHDKHIEVPLWQLKLYKSASRARKAASALGEFRYTYAKVKTGRGFRSARRPRIPRNRCTA